ncbi:MAG TPA: hypothetical protein DG754_10190 [Bacteroidales bacterium]|nr:hypothetical protein [Bacteroidales bacterium]
MKILMVLDHEFPTDVRVENEATALITAGHEVHIACYTQKEKPANEVFKSIHIHRVEISGLMYKLSAAALTLPFYFRFWFKFLDGLFKKHGFQAIHIHDLPLSKVGSRISKKFGVQLTIDLHENWPALLRVSTHTSTLIGRMVSPNFLWTNYERRILKRANAIIVVVDEAKERISALGIDRNKIFVVSNTLNMSEFDVAAEKTDSNHFTLYYAGGINFHRGLQTVIEAVAIAKDEVTNLRFRIAGFGSYRHNLEELVNKLGLTDRIEFLGYLTLKAVARNLSQADVALIPHLKTPHTDSTIPHKLFQYMYINKPIIASNCAPIERIVNETNSGIIFNSGDADDLAKKIVQLATKSVIIPNARHWVKEKYCWDNDSKVLVKIYS